MQNVEHSLREKAKAAKCGPGCLSKTLSMGVRARTFALTVHWEPTISDYRIAIHVPEGWLVPDVNRMVAKSSAAQLCPSQESATEITASRQTSKDIAIVRRKGRNLLSRAKRLGVGSRIFALVLYWDLGYREYHLGVHHPSGWVVPDINQMIDAALPAQQTAMIKRNEEKGEQLSD
jgi:hypothetical protein